MPRTATKPHIETVVLGDFETNCFVVTIPAPDPQSELGEPAGQEPPGDAQAGKTPRDCWIVDCGMNPEPMFDFIEREGLRPRAILLTHAHYDHIAGVDAALTRFGSMPIHLHEAERGFCSNPMLNLSGALGASFACTEPDHWLRDGDEITMGSSRWRVVHAPGHSPGCVLFIHDESKQAIVGDTLFAGSIGRIDFPTSDPEAMRRTIRDVMMGLPDDLAIHPGHGPATTIGAERVTNPYVIGGF